MLDAHDLGETVLAYKNSISQRFNFIRNRIVAIPKPLADCLCGENAWRPLPKSILLLGRQTIPFTEQLLRELALKWNLPVGEIEIDGSTTFALQNPGSSWITWPAHGMPPASG